MSRYRTPKIEDAEHVAAIAQDALQAARDRAPDQDGHARRLFDAIYGPLGERSLIAYKNGIKSRSKGVPQ